MAFISTKLGARLSAPLLLSLMALPGAAAARPAAGMAAAVAAVPDYGVQHFYRQRGYRPLWFQDGRAAPAARRLVAILRDAELDGVRLDPARLHWLDRVASGAEPLDGGAAARAEMAFSAAWVDYSRAMARAPEAGVTFIDPSLAPAQPFPAAVLAAAAAAPSLDRHLAEATRVNPIYDALRAAYAERRGRMSADEEARLRLNMERARVLPRTRAGKYLVVDAAAQRLHLFEDGRLRDSMRVVVGKPSEPTPMAAGLIRTLVLNPYWNVPEDLVRKSVAPKVLARGLRHISDNGFEVFSGWDEGAEPLDAAAVDWAAVAAGHETVRVRQRPGAANAMGRMKFLFPNRFGVYLHDTPEKELFAASSRTFSSGCVRLEDAPRLARWLFGEVPDAPDGGAEREVPLPEPVPVHLTYLTVDWTRPTLAARPDVYGRDRVAVEAASYAHGTESPRG